MKHAVLVCSNCGAPLPLSDTAEVRCRHCDALTAVPSEYADLRNYARQARETRRKAEAAYKEMLDAAIPEWVPRWWARAGIPLLVLGCPLFLWLTQDSFAWQFRTWLVFAVFGPLLIGCLALAPLMVAAQPFVYLQAIGGKLRPGPPDPRTGQLTCGVCGAPLEPEPDCLSATCGYCLSDSWLLAVPVDHVRGVEREGKNLADLTAALAFKSFDLRLFLGVSFVVAGGFLLLLWIGATPDSLQGVERRCEKGDARACDALGAFYADGRREGSLSTLSSDPDVRVDPARSRHFFTLGCDARSAESCLSLARAARDGTGQAKSLQTAKRWASRACALDDIAGCLNLGDLASELDDAGGARIAYHKAWELSCQQTGEKSIACRAGKLRGANRPIDALFWKQFR